MTRAHVSLPLAIWVAGGCFGAIVTTLGGVALILVDDGLTGRELLALGVGLLLMVIITGVALIWARYVTAGLRELHTNAIRRLRSSNGGGQAMPAKWKAVDASSELIDLARVLDALHLRARVADEVAEQARRTAEHASAGMFELLSGLVAAEEATRGQLSAELHDTVAQTLMAARAELASEEHDSGRLDRVGSYVEEAEEQVRAVMARARPPELQDADLASAVSILRREFARRYLLTVHVVWPAEPYPLPLVLAVTVYRFFQEALLNVVKHADVSEAHVSLAMSQAELVAQVKDDGEGFLPEAVRSTGGRHVGLGLLRERARLAGGTLTVDSGAAKGTRLTLRLPLPSVAAPSARVGQD